MAHVSFPSVAFNVTLGGDLGAVVVIGAVVIVVLWGGAVVGLSAGHSSTSNKKI